MISALQKTGISLLIGSYLAGCAAVASAPSAGSAPEAPDCSASFDAAPTFTLKERFSLVPTYDATVDGCPAAVLTAEIFNLTAKYRLADPSGEPLGSIELDLLSLGYDAHVYGPDGTLEAVADHKVMESLGNWGGLYIEVKEPDGNVAAVVRQDAFSFFTSGTPRHFDVLSPDEKTVVATVDYRWPTLLDTYDVRVTDQRISNRSLAGLTVILDHVLDAAESDDDE